MQRLKKFILSLIILCLLVPKLSSQNIIHVNQNANGTNSGSSWTDAFVNLQDAITQADSNTMIWIAEGIYFPTNTNDRTISFLLKNGVQMYGGFEGNENNLAERDFVNNPTTLSGDIGITGDSTDNSYHVVYSIGTDSTAKIDGFIIRDGQARHDNIVSPFNFGGGIQLAIDEEHSFTNPVISNNRFIHNTTRFYGGAINCSSSDFGMARPLITNCYFRDNSAWIGGGIYKDGNALDSTSFIVHGCTFETNTALSGAAISFLDVNGLHILDSCFFIGKHSSNKAAVLFETGQQHNGELTLKNCHFDHVTDCGFAVVYIRITDHETPKDRYINIIDCSFIGENIQFPNIQPIIKTIFSSPSEEKRMFFNMTNTYFDDMRTHRQTAVVDFMFNPTTNFIDISINNCYFKGNTATPTSLTTYSNAFSISGTNPQGQVPPDSLKLNVYNSIFNETNRALVIKAGVHHNSTIQANFNNCTFYNNGKSIFYRNWSPDAFHDHHINVSNSMIWTDSPIDSIFHNHNNNTDSITFEGYNVHHCLINTPDCMVNGVDACGSGMLYQLDPLFVDSMNGDFRLRACSPAINVGDNNSTNTSLIPFDYQGQLRILEDIVDIGAFEQYSTPIIEPIIESISSTGATDGSITIDSVYGGTPPYSYLWDTGDTGNTLVNLSAGVYIVTITDAIGCELVDSITVGLFTGLDELEEQQSSISIFPNPSSGQIIIQVTEKQQGLIKIELIDLWGRTLLQQEGEEMQEIKLNQFADGVYFVKAVFADGGMATERVFLQRD